MNEKTLESSNFVANLYMVSNFQQYKKSKFPSIKNSYQIFDYIDQFKIGKNIKDIIPPCMELSSWWNFDYASNFYQKYNP